MDKHISNKDTIDNLRLALFAVGKQTGYVSEKIRFSLFENLFGQDYLFKKMREQTETFMTVNVHNPFTTDVTDRFKMKYGSTIVDLKNLLFKKYGKIQHKRISLIDNDLKLYRNHEVIVPGQKISMIKNKMYRDHYVVPPSFYIKDNNRIVPLLNTIEITLRPYLLDPGLFTVNFKQCILPKIAYISNDLTFGYGTIHIMTKNTRKMQLQIVKLYFNNNDNGSGNIQIKVLASHETKTMTSLTVNNDGTKILYLISYGGTEYVPNLKICEIDTLCGKSYIDKIPKIYYDIKNLCYSGDNIVFLHRSKIYLFKRNKKNKLCFVKKHIQRYKNSNHTSSIQTFILSNYGDKTKYITMLKDSGMYGSTIVGMFSENLFSVKRHVGPKNSSIHDDNVIMKLSHDQRYVYVASGTFSVNLNIYDVDTKKHIQRICIQRSEIIFDFFILPNNKILMLCRQIGKRHPLFAIYDLTTKTKEEIVLDIPNIIILKEKEYSADHYCCNEEFPNLGLYFYNYEHNTLIVHNPDDHSVNMVNLDNYTM